MAIAYQIIPVIPQLHDDTRAAAREAFARSLIVLWEVMIGIAGLGLLTSLFMKALPLHTQRDEQWALEGSEVDEPEKNEKGSVGSVAVADV